MGDFVRIELPLVVVFGKKEGLPEYYITRKKSREEDPANAVSMWMATMSSRMSNRMSYRASATAASMMRHFLQAF